jgi:light-regulated signal transduction histidine kinase (bacteriophytochrome)
MRMAAGLGGTTIALAIVCIAVAVVLVRLAWRERDGAWGRVAAFAAMFVAVLGVSQIVTPIANGHWIAIVIDATAAVLGLVALTAVWLARPARDTAPTTSLLEGANRRLAAEVREREHAEGEIRRVTTELEQRVAERTRELERSNRELEQFAYVASHDLREPLRMIASYSDLLARRYRGKLDDTADEFIAYILDGCQRMRQLIDDLLEYSRVDRQRMPQLVDAEEALEVACRDLAVPIARADAVITHDPLPQVVCTRVQLVQLLENLFRNALTYRADRPTKIHVGVQEKDDEIILTVRDNGQGFEMRHADRIFGMFQRLHLRGEYPGTGMGLAMCRKIMECHGGRIWAQAEPGVGATFSCAFPRTSMPTAVAS